MSVAETILQKKLLNDLCFRFALRKARVFF